jgi:hypothetical protein
MTAVIPLDSPRWSELNHAYGDGGDLPEILGRLADGDEETLGDLYGSICHQGKGRRTAPRPPIPDDVRAAYEAALPRALELALTTLTEPLEPSYGVYLLEAAATLDGRSVLGSVLTGFVAEEFLAVCPGCRRELFIWPTDDGLSAAVEDPVRGRKTPRTPIVPGPESAHEADYQWLMRVGGAAALSLIDGRLPSLFGRGTCPPLRRRLFRDGPARRLRLTPGPNRPSTPPLRGARGPEVTRRPRNRRRSCRTSVAPDRRRCSAR